MSLESTLLIINTNNHILECQQRISTLSLAGKKLELLSGERDKQYFYKGLRRKHTMRLVGFLASAEVKVGRGLRAMYQEWSNLRSIRKIG